MTSAFSVIRNTRAEDCRSVRFFLHSWVSIQASDVAAAVEHAMHNVQRWHSRSARFGERRVRRPDRRANALRIGLGGAVLLWVLGACGEIDLGERPWVCDRQATELTSLKASTSSFIWSFDNQPVGLSDYEPYVLLTVAPSPADKSYQIRLGGKGASFFASSSTDISVDTADPAKSGAAVTTASSSGAITYSFWISLSKSWLGDASTSTLVDAGTSTTVELLSTLKEGSDCSGHKISLTKTNLTPEKKAQLLLSLEYYDRDCATQQVGPVELTPLHDEDEWVNPSGLVTADAWGLGIWHHIAATVDSRGSQDESSISVYWDGARVEVATFKPSDGNGVTTNEISVLDLHLGPEASSKIVPYELYIDDLALIPHALDSKDVASLRVNSASRYELDGLGWSTWNALRSTASWNEYQTEGLSVSCEDGKSSACGATATLDWDTSLANLDYVTLNADLPIGHAADFMLAADTAGRQFCKWSVRGAGGAAYRFSVNASSQVAPQDNTGTSAINELKWCKCDTCECNFIVRNATIGSTWTDQDGPFPCLVCDLEHQAIQPVNGGNNTRRGAWGPGNLCWRPIAYEDTSHTEIVEISREAPVTAKLSGPKGTTSLLAADFSVKPDTEGSTTLDYSKGYVDLRQKRVFLCAHLPRNHTFQIVLKSDNDGYCELKVEGSDPDDPSESSQKSTVYPALPREGETSDVLDADYCANHADPKNKLLDEKGAPPTFDPTRVRYVGIQKAWEDNVQNLMVRVDAIKFVDATTTAASVDCSPASSKQN
jgi:hypothetical protein